ncbi:hypothetical protein PV327_004934 [Microctonus hyperodae]|uniref:Uncharacterized protein n=1 Tax=Microctonus hyperodae TaxID=165561 RepID=A0AA39FDU4_MICHY|nr:hypothetical protein PV327_004934 [Microctonus hyperodae]
MATDCVHEREPRRMDQEIFQIGHRTLMSSCSPSFLGKGSIAKASSIKNSTIQLVTGIQLQLGIRNVSELNINNYVRTQVTFAIDNAKNRLSESMAEVLVILFPNI